MCDQDYKRTTSNYCFFVKKFSNNDFIILFMYVNDIVIIGKNISRIDMLKKTFSESFAMKDLGSAKRILDINISCDRREKKIGLSK